MHILIIGARGQLGTALQAAYAKQTDCHVTTWNRPQYDITHPHIAQQIAAFRPDVVINTAAWVDVDGAESNIDTAYAANALGPYYLATGCHQCGATLVQISTNEVFAGISGRFYYEYDQPMPSNVYARSKLAGETAARQVLDRLYIVRVAWLFGPGGNNFPTKIAAAADKHGALNVVSDEIGNPTYAPDAAEAIVQLVQSEYYGIYHIVNEGQASRYELAQAVMNTSGRGHIPLTPIASSEWPRPAPPPLHAVLVNQAAKALGIVLRPWQDAVEEYMAIE